MSDNIWAKAKIPNETGKVGLWLGANVMVEYSYDDALKLLAKNLASAEERLAEADSDIDYLKDQITTSEVNIARIYNSGLAIKQRKEKEEKKTQWYDTQHAQFFCPGQIPPSLSVSFNNTFH